MFVISQQAARGGNLNFVTSLEVTARTLRATPGGRIVGLILLRLRRIGITVLDSFMRYLLVPKHHILSYAPLRTEVFTAMGMIQEVLNAPNPKYYSLTRPNRAGVASDRQFTQKCPILAQVWLYVRNIHEPTTINPNKYRGMKAWDDLTHQERLLITVAREAAGATTVSGDTGVFETQQEQDRAEEELRTALDALQARDLSDPLNWRKRESSTNPVKVGTFVKMVIWICTFWLANHYRTIIPSHTSIRCMYHYRPRPTMLKEQKKEPFLGRRSNLTDIIQTGWKPPTSTINLPWTCAFTKYVFQCG